MKRVFVLLGLVAFFSASLVAQGYQVGDKAEDFKLLNVDGKYVSMSDFNEAKGFIVIFTCNHCPYAIAYEQRIIELDIELKKKGFPVIAINSNDSTMVPEDSYSNMIKRAKEKKYPFPYLLDAKQEIFKIYGATKTPHVYILNKEGNDLQVAYIGTIDNNYKNADEATEHYVKMAVENLLAGKSPDPNSTKAIGCSIKYKKAE